MTRNPTYTWIGLCLLVSCMFISGCANKVLIATGTTIGLSASPGDGSTRPPKVTLAYKRAETALIPTGSKRAVSDPQDPSKNSDAFSTMAVFYFSTKWFGETRIESFISTGHASRLLLGDETNPSEFSKSFANATLGVVPQSIQDRRTALERKRLNLTEEQAKVVLTGAGFTLDPNQNALDVLQDHILHAQTDSALKNLEASFGRLP